MFNWRRPTNLGVNDGRLAPCRRTPNCVSSQADPADAEHYIAPIRSRGAIAARAQRPSNRCRRTTVVSASSRTTCTRSSAAGCCGFVDDVEFFDDGTAIQVRSASRLGRRDFGVNRKRVEQLRALITVEALICVRCRSRRARGSNASRRCRVQRLSHTMHVADAPLLAEGELRLRGVRPQLVEQRFAFV